MVEGKFNEIHGWAAIKPGLEVERWSYKPRPLGENDIEIKIDYSGVCSTDLHVIRGDWGKDLFPTIVGHEIVGRVVTKGENVTEFHEGEIVGVGPQVSACRDSTCHECSRSLDQHCSQKVFTYNDVYGDGNQAQGGYAEAIRVDSRYVFKIPSNLDPAYVAPLMCAGSTVYAPMLHAGVKKGDRVGVVGIGGLGHLAIKYAKAIGAEVVAFSHSPKKRDETLELGASEFVNTANADEVQAIRGTLQYLFVTSNVDPRKYKDFVTWMDFKGQIILLALAQGELEVSPILLAQKKVSITGSLIASREDQKAMLEFSAAHNILPVIETLPIDKVNDAIQRVENGKAHFRIVLVHGEDN
ncbi:hypothetical protein LPJ73_005143 [Coemansia sp. RSA 2703]|nr:hypothetical protein LPJ73_005143 [Coemansia sp. RSA 2703]KAJ2370784.1 hypothetical protein IW150_004871 [Coemansia sp. RSA 2607]KAJ2389402.1 hypothetical protein GGI05_003515 [Coemansia sp. RSA 2603]